MFPLTETLNRSIYSQPEPLFLPQSILPPHWLAPFSPFRYISHPSTTQYYSCLHRTMEPTQSSETSAYILRTPGKFPKEYLLYSEHGESLKTTNYGLFKKLTTKRHDFINFLLAGRIRMFHPDPARKLSANPYDIYHCCVYSEKLPTMDRGTVQNM